MQTMYQDMEGILEYTNALEDAQKHSNCVDATHMFTDYNLMVVASAAMLATE